MILNIYSDIQSSNPALRGVFRNKRRLQKQAQASETSAAA